MNDLDLATELADLADSISYRHFVAQDFTVETKPDLTPVTECDRAVEAAIVDRLKRERPDDSVLGEEFGSHGTSPRRWIIDPIDGTKNYVRGVPIRATLISLYDGQTPLLGVISVPALGRRWWAEAGHGAFTSALGEPARQIHVSAVDSLEDASMSYASLSGWKQLGVLDEFLDLCDSLWRTRGYGDFYSYMLLAEGAVDLAGEPEWNSTIWARWSRSFSKRAEPSPTPPESTVPSAATLSPATPGCTNLPLIGLAESHPRRFAPTRRPEYEQPPRIR